MTFYDVEGQQERARQINEFVIQNHLKDIDQDGNLIGVKWQRCGLKELIWFCEALWNTDAKYAELTEKIILNHPEFQRFHTFVPFMCMVNLVRNQKTLTKPLIKEFEETIKRTMEINLLDTWDFIGVNDNTPAMIMACVIMAGEYFGRKDWLEAGKKRLVQLQEMLQRRGFISEFNSPTYTPITIYSLATIVHYVKDSDCVNIALQLELDLWKKKLVLCYPDMGNTAGPYSRAYEEDKRCQTYNNRYLFYALLGDACTVNPLNTIFEENSRSNFYFQLANVWIANMVYHCPAEYVEDLFQREYPYSVRGTAEVSVSADTYLIPCTGGDLSDANLLNADFSSLYKQDDLYEYQSAVVQLHTYMERHYALGTATKEFHSGNQTDSFHILYTKNGPAKRQEDIGAVFANYLINDEISFRNDAGRKIALQEKNSAMVLYRPKPFENEVKTAKLQIVCDNMKYLVNRAVIGGMEFDQAKLQQKDFKFEANVLLPVFVEATSIYLFFYPLIAEKDRAEASMELSQIEDTLCISFYNYKAPQAESGRRFHQKELCLMTNGFVCEVRKKEEYASFEAFCEEMKRFEVEDRMYANVHSRYAYTREVKYQTKNVNLACCYSPLSEGIKYMTGNGQVIEDKKFEIVR